MEQKPEDSVGSGNGGLPQLLLLLEGHLVGVEVLLHPGHDEVPLAGQVVRPVEAPVQPLLFWIPAHHKIFGNPA